MCFRIFGNSGHQRRKWAGHFKKKLQYLRNLSSLKIEPWNDGSPCEYIGQVFKDF